MHHMSHYIGFDRTPIRLQRNETMSDHELRIKCAEAMGWTKVGQLKWNDDKLDPPKQFMDGCGHTPDYPADLNAALALVDALVDKGWCCTMENNPNKSWEVNIFPSDSGEPIANIYIVDPSLARAICRGFLEVMEKI